MELNFLTRLDDEWELLMVDEWFEVAEGGRLNPGPDEELN